MWYLLLFGNDLLCIETNDVKEWLLLTSMILLCDYCINDIILQWQYSLTIIIYGITYYCILLLMLFI